MNVTCGFDKGLLAAHYDGETTADERAQVERHVASCPECARDLAAMKQLSAALKPLAKGAAPMSIAEGVLREVGRTRKPRRWIGWAASAAAAIVLAIGTFYVIDRGSPAPGVEKTLAAERRQDLARPAAKDARSEMKAKLETAPPAAPAPEPPGDREDLVKMFRNWTGMLFVRVKSSNPADARAIVESYLKEKKIQDAPNNMLADRYLPVDLTDAETAEVEKRLAALKETTLAKATLEEEKKRLGEANKTAEESDSSGLRKESRSRAAPAETDRLQPSRRRVLFIFEPPPAK